MPHVAALYRYPVKGMTPEECPMLTIRADGRVMGDRVLGVRFADTDASDDAWSSKHGMVALVNTPGLARLSVTYDEISDRLTISNGFSTVADELLTSDGRARVAKAIENYVLSLEENPLTGNPQRLPLRLVGDGRTSRYQDNPQGLVSMHAQESVAALAKVLGSPELSEARFRSNIAIEGVEAWEEQSWGGRRLRIGSVEFEVIKVNVRCLATHANPETGQRDLPVMETLIKVLGNEQPTFGVMMLPAGAGDVYLGDDLRVV